MATRTKLTPFARLFLVLLFIVPLAYGGALYIQGKDPVAEVQGMFNGEKSPESNTTSSSTYDPQQQIEKLKKENQQLKKRVEELEAELKTNRGNNSGAQKWGN